MKKLTAAVTTRTVQEPNYKEVRDAISHDMVNFLHNQNIDPIILPNNLEIAINLSKNADLLVITGGNSVNLTKGPSPFFEAEMEHNKICRELISDFIDMSLPVFGICYGLQIINSYFGGLIGEVESKDFHVNNEHEVKIIGDQYVELFESSSLVVNSFHNDSITKLGKGLEAIAFSIDNTIEAITHHQEKILGIMWHPERYVSDKKSRKINELLIRSFIDI